MILKKPYGFLIKNFKVIHLILLMIYVYLVYKVQGILNYYNDYLSNAASKFDALSYINYTFIIFVLFSFLICGVVYALMRYKKKPRMLYVVLVLIYVFVSGVIIYSYGGLQKLYISTLDLKSLRLYRDILQIAVWVQYYALIVVLIRALGFDIKKFNFVKDLEDLGLDVSDEEEVELTLGGMNQVSRKFHRMFRELKYYYYENKIFIYVIFVVLIVFLGSGLFVKNEIIDKKYEQGEVISTDKFNFSVVNCYVTNRGYDNQMVSLENKSFVIIEMSISSKVGKTTFNSSNVILYVNGNNYTVDTRYERQFSDLGDVYKGETLQNTSNYLFVFPIPSNEITGKMWIDYAGEQVIHLNPNYLDQASWEKEYKVGEMTDFSNSVLGSGGIKISSYEVGSSFQVPYTYLIMGKEEVGEYTVGSFSNTIIHLVMETNLPDNYTSYSFLETYGKVYYEIGGEEFTSYVFTDRTPDSYKDGIYLEVDKKVERAEKIWIDFKIRGNSYIYTLK